MSGRGSKEAVLPLPVREMAVQDSGELDLPVCTAVMTTHTLPLSGCGRATPLYPAGAESEEAC